MSSIAEELEAIIRSASRLAESGQDAERRRIEDQRRKMRDDRAARLRPYEGMLPPDDYGRLLDGKLDSEIWTRAVGPAYTAWLEDRLRFLWISAPPGTGKTVAALAVLMREGGELLSMLKLLRAYEHETEEAIALRARAERARVLIVDDVGTAGSPTEEHSALYTVVNERQGSGRFTILTSNLSKQSVQAYGVRIHDRIAKQGAIVWLDGKSLRRPK